MCYILQSAGCPIPFNGIYCALQTIDGASTSTSHGTSIMSECENFRKQDLTSIVRKFQMKPSYFKECQNYRIMYREKSIIFLSDNFIPTWLNNLPILQKAPACEKDDFAVDEWTFPIYNIIPAEPLTVPRHIYFNPSNPETLRPGAFISEADKFLFFIRGSSPGLAFEVEKEEISTTSSNERWTFGSDKMRKLGIDFRKDGNIHSSCVVAVKNHVSMLYSQLPF